MAIDVAGGDGASHHSKAAVFGTLLRSYRSVSGTISPPALERTLGPAALTGDARGDKEALASIREHLQAHGFTAAPGSAELVGLLWAVTGERLRLAGADFRDCVGLSQAQLAAPAASGLSHEIAAVVRASLAQLSLVLPGETLVLGPLEGTFRGQLGGIGWLHTDENRTSAAYLQQALFPLPRADADQDASSARCIDTFEHYGELCERLQAAYPELSLPCPPECRHAADDAAVAAGAAAQPGSCAAQEQAPEEHDLQAFAYSIIDAITDYNRSRACPAEELVLDFINVWIPKAEKQLALLPFELSGGGEFRNHETRPSVEEVEASNFQHQFQAFSTGTAVMFFGRHVMHQAAEGPCFSKCGHGSMETRYLILTPRGSAHRFSLRRLTCISEPALGSVESIVAAPAAESELHAVASSNTHEVLELAGVADTAAAGAEKISPTYGDIWEEVANCNIALDDEPHLLWYQALWSE